MAPVYPFLRLFNVLPTFLPSVFISPSFPPFHSSLPLSLPSYVVYRSSNGTYIQKSNQTLDAESTRRTTPHPLRLGKTVLNRRLLLIPKPKSKRIQRLDDTRRWSCRVTGCMCRVTDAFPSILPLASNFLRHVEAGTAVEAGFDRYYRGNR